jgi:DNA modification methylase
VVDGATDAAMNDLPANWPAAAVERRPLQSLVPYAQNARTHSAAQIGQLAASIRQWGWTVPVLVDERDEVIAGHGRLLAAEELGLAEVPVMVARGWTARQIKAYRLADNQLALNAAWDVKLLAAELGELTDMAELIGFSDDELQRVLGGRQGLTDPDEAPPLPAESASRTGDLWICGKHRLLCGDATDAASVGRLLGKVKPNLMVTDPPYGVEYDADWRNQRVRSDGSPIAGRAIGKVQNDHRADWREAYSLFPGSVAYAWSAGLRSKEAIEGLHAAGFDLRAQIIWAKTRFAIGRGDYHFQHEPCWYAVRKGGKSGWQGARDQATLWEINHIKSETGHSAQKPVECMRRPIVNNSSPGQAVYDPFVGSGTTMIAAEMEARAALCLEIDPGYCDVAVERWQAFTGEQATLDGDGRTFDALAAERA